MVSLISLAEGKRGLLVSLLLVLFFFYWTLSASFHKLINQNRVESSLNYTGTDDLHSKLSSANLPHKLLMRLSLTLPKSMLAWMDPFLTVDLEGLMSQLFICGYVFVFTAGTVLPVWPQPCPSFQDRRKDPLGCSQVHIQC